MNREQQKKQKKNVSAKKLKIKELQKKMKIRLNSKKFLNNVLSRDL
jgi:hypothetical protein